MHINLDTSAKPIVRITFIVAMLSIALTFAAVYYRTSGLIEQEIANLVSQEIGELQTAFQKGGEPGLRQALQSRTERLNADKWRYYLADQNGQRLAGTLLDPPEKFGEEAGWRTVPIRLENAQESQLFGLQEVALSPGYRLVVARDMSIREKFQRAVAQGLIAAFIFTIALTALTGFVLSRALLSRIGTITETTDAVMKGDLSRRIGVFRHSDEFTALARSLNSMLTRVEGLVISTRVISDSSMHHVRNTLTRLKSRLEILPHSAVSVAEYEKALDRTLRDLDALLKTLSNLMDIARVEAGIGREQMTSIDLAALVESIGDLYEPYAEESGLNLVTDQIGPLTIFGHSELIAQAISNLVENAIKYSGKGTTVALRAGLNPLGPTVTVSDQGPGIPPNQLAQAMERFVRLEGSGNVPGAGLGLSLVAAVARLHDADFYLQNANPGLRAVLRFHNRD